MILHYGRWLGQDKKGKLNDFIFLFTAMSSIAWVRAKSFTEDDIFYTLKSKGRGAETFNINSRTGKVRLTKDLNFEDMRQPKVYALIVTATEDSGGFSTSVELTIRVTDVNDNAPKFELLNYQAHNIDEVTYKKSFHSLEWN